MATWNDGTFAGTVHDHVEVEVGTGVRYPAEKGYVERVAVPAIELRFGKFVPMFIVLSEAAADKLIADLTKARKEMKHEEKGG